MKKRIDRAAFTMVELVFVIVVIGILAAVAIPKLAASRDDAVIAKARTTVAAVRSSVRTERHKRILRGDFDHPITSLHNAANTVFDVFNADKDGRRNKVLETIVYDCDKLEKSTGCWSVTGSGPSDYKYIYTLPDGNNVDFNLTNSRFTCESPGSSGCLLIAN